MKDMIVGQTVEQLPGEGTVTTLHLSEEARAALSVGGDSAKEFLRRSLSSYRRRLNRYALTQLMLSVAISAMAIYVTVLSFMNGSLLGGFLWVVIAVLNLLCIPGELRQLRETKGTWPHEEA